MKKFLLSLIIVCAGFSTSPAKDHQMNYGFAYWVLEENIQPNSVQIIKYYSAEHELIHEETVTDKRIDIKSRRTVAKLNKSLENVLEKSDSDIDNASSMKNICGNMR